jgi:hypothetical protein
VHAPTPSARGAEPLRPFPSVCLPSRCARMLKFDTISGPTESRRTAACSPRNTQRSARALARVCVCVCVLSVCVCVCVSCALISIVGTTPRWAADATRAYDSCSGSGRGELVARQIPRRASVNQRRTVCDYGPTGANWLQHRPASPRGSTVHWA